MSQARTKINIFEKVKLVLSDGKEFEMAVKVDTGAYRTSIDKHMALELGLVEDDNHKGNVTVRSSLGKHKRPVVGITYLLGGQLVQTTASLTDRSNMNFPMIIGRRDLVTFSIEYNPKNEVEKTRVK